MQGSQRVAVIGLSLGSILHFRRWLLKDFVERGHAVTVYASAEGSTRAHVLTELGVQFREIPLRRTGSNPVHDAATIRALFRLWRKARPDVVLNCAVKPAIYGSLAARWSGAPRIFSLITGRGSAFSGGRGVGASLAELALRFVCRHSLACNRVVFFQNSDDQDFYRRARLVGEPTQTVLVNGSGVDLDHYRPTPLPRTPAFLFMGRFLRNKGIIEYVQAARLIKAQHPEIACRLVGSIDPGHPTAITESELQSWIAEGAIEHLGRLRDVRPALTRTSVFVLPSYYPEGQPRSILEAMAMGRPIITTDSPGCRETVEPGRNGFLVPPRDVDALAARMETFLREPAMIARMGRESRRIAEARYDVHDVNRIIMETMELA